MQRCESSCVKVKFAGDRSNDGRKLGDNTRRGVLTRRRMPARSASEWSNKLSRAPDRTLPGRSLALPAGMRAAMPARSASEWLHKRSCLANRTLPGRSLALPAGMRAEAATRGRSTFRVLQTEFCRVGRCRFPLRSVPSTSAVGISDGVLSDARLFRRDPASNTAWLGGRLRFASPRPFRSWGCAAETFARRLRQPRSGGR